MGILPVCSIAVDLSMILNVRRGWIHETCNTSGSTLDMEDPKDPIPSHMGSRHPSSVLVHTRGVSIPVQVASGPPKPSLLLRGVSRSLGSVGRWEQDLLPFGWIRWDGTGTRFEVGLERGSTSASTGIDWGMDPGGRGMDRSYLAATIAAPFVTNNPSCWIRNMQICHGSRIHVHGRGRARHLEWCTREGGIARATLDRPNTTSRNHRQNQNKGLKRVPVPLVPILLRLEDVKGQVKDVHMATLEQNAQGVVRMEELLLEGLLPGEDLQWPVEPLKSRIMRNMARMKLQTFAKQYKPVRETLLKDLLETLLAFELHRRGLHQEEEDNEQDGDTSMFSSSGVKEEAVDFTQTEQYKKWLEKRQKSEEEAAARAAKQAQADAELAFTSEQVLGWWDNLQYDGPEEEVVLANAMADKFYERWSPAMEALEKASRAFDFMEELLGGADGSFELQSNMWRRNAWKEMDKLRRTLENCRQLRDLVRSLGRSAGWGPLRRSPTQVPKDNAKDGLLRTVLEAQETRGLTRSDNISSMLPMEATLLAKGQKMRQAKLLFFQRVVERMLLSYERDGWAEIPAIAPDLNIREIRPTAERGPILLCLDTSGSMRGKRETVSKAIALECMRAAKVQERGCHVFCFSGPKVWELELGTDRESLVNLLDFLERIFNGGTEFSETLKRCLSRLETAEWANSDILLVTDGELRQPEPGLMRKLTGAKEAMGLRVHGLIIGSPETPKDPLVMKSLCTNYTRGAKDELLLHTFDNWGLLPDDFDFDDKVATALRVERSKRLEKARKEEEKRRRLDARAAAKKKG